MKRLKAAIAGLVLLFAGCSGINQDFAEQQEEFRKEVEPALEAYQAKDEGLTAEQRASWARFFRAWQRVNEEALK